jgi:hypothetical protein
MIYLNPLLALAGYHIYVVRMSPSGRTDATISRSFLLSHKEDLRPGEQVRPDRISRGVFIDLTPRTDATNQPR